MFYYFLLVSALYLGFFSLPYHGLITEIVFSPLIIYSFFSAKEFFKNLRGAKLFVISWTFFIIYYFILLLSAENLHSQLTPFVNVRGIYPFLFFYITIAVVNNKHKLKKLIKFVSLLTILASFFAILQSIHGPEPIFDPNRFYNIGHWAGQGGQMIGPIARVMLPTIYLIYIVFVAFLVVIFLTKKTNYLLFLFILVIPILISFSRSNWFAISVAVFVTFSILRSQSMISKSTLFVSLFSMLVLVGLILIFLSLDNPISTSLSERFISFFSDIKTSSGNYEVRIVNSAVYLADWQARGFYFGIDPLYMERFDTFALSDVGFVHVLVTTGIVGLILFLLVWLSGIGFAIRTLRIGVKTNKINLVIIGAILFASIIYFIISQQYIQGSYTSALFSIICGLAIASRKILND